MKCRETSPELRLLKAGKVSGKAHWENQDFRDEFETVPYLDNLQKWGPTGAREKRKAEKQIAVPERPQPGTALGRSYSSVY